MDHELRRVRAELSISQHVGAAVTASFLPVPGVDIATITGVQISMLVRLCRLYEVPFSREALRSILGAVIGASVPGLQATLVSSSLKAVPVLGTAAAYMAAPALAAASTFAVGKVFQEHLETGGTLLTFDSTRMRQHFEKRLAEERERMTRGATDVGRTR